MSESLPGPLELLLGIVVEVNQEPKDERERGPG